MTQSQRQYLENNSDMVSDDLELLKGLPDNIVKYLIHTSGGLSIRALARAENCHASTVLRQVRRIETRRDDPLLDEGLNQMGTLIETAFRAPEDQMELTTMAALSARPAEKIDKEIAREARRILRRLCETGAFMAVAQEMEKAVVMRETIPGQPHRIAVVDRKVAHKFALLDWISCQNAGKIAKYNITSAGRAALKRLLAEDQAKRSAESSEQKSPFAAQHQIEGERRVMDEDGGSERVLRTNLAESPLAALGRKRDRNGVTYMTPRMVEAGERLREDFELAHMGQRTTQNWEAFLTPGNKGQVPGSSEPASGPTAARNRVSEALSTMGPGLSDIAFRVCCYLEGLETAEKRMGWSARSGKVVLRIALERLADHYGLRERQAVA